METTIAATNGSTKTISTESANKLRSQLKGKLIEPSDPGYDECRKIWNAMIDRKPALIAQCMDSADIINCVNFARENEMNVSVRGAGHNIAGMCLANDALLVDLSQMKEVKVDPESKTATVEPGATLHLVDHATQAFGLAVPTGINSTTGIAGLTLGGGFGWISRSFGLTTDNLISAQVVTADGKLVTANEKENPDLFWAIRGGSGNFGIVSSFHFRLHEVGPMVLAGLIVHPFSDAKELFEEYKKITAAAPEKFTTWVVLRKAPPLPFLPESVHGTDVFVFASIYAGDIKEGEKIMEPLRQLGKPIADVIGPVPFEAWQQAFDPLLTPGMRNYWKSHNFTSLENGLVDTLLAYAGQLPSPHSEIFVGHLGGAINKLAADATAYPHRDVNYAVNVHTRWETNSDDNACVKWARELFDKMTPYSNGGVYVNFISEGEDRINAAFGKNYEKLARVKAKYDPENFFHVNQNIKPA